MSNVITASGPAQHQQGRVVSRRLDDFADFSNLFDQWNGQFHQMSRGNFEGSIQVVTGQKVRLFQAETNQAILTRGMDSDSAIFIPITARNASTRWAGRRLRLGSMLAKRPEAEYNNQTAPNSVIRALLVPVDVLHSAARTLSGGYSDLELPLWSEQTPSSGKMKRFQQGLDGLFLAGIQTPSQCSTAPKDERLSWSACVA